MKIVGDGIQPVFLGQNLAMKLLSTLTLCLAFGAVYAQPKVVTNAVVSTTTNVIAPEEDELQNVQNNQGGPGMNFRNFGDGETKSTTYIKGGMVKTVMKNDMGRSTIIRNNDSKLTTTLIEMMGNKTGFYITDEEQANMRKRMDSMQNARPRDSANANRGTRLERTVDVVYTEETKKISGYTCKKAYIVRSSILGKDSMAVWYTPEIKIANTPSTGGMSGFGAMGGSMNNGFDKIDGFVMQYETKMPRGRKMEVTVNKIELDKKIEDKEFEVPKDFDVKPMKEFQGMMRGGPGNVQFQIRQ